MKRTIVCTPPFFFTGGLSLLPNFQKGGARQEGAWRKGGGAAFEEGVDTPMHTMRS